MQSKNNILTFDAKLTNFEKLNDRFTKAKCYVLTTGKNINKSYISEEAVNNAYYSLSYVPVIGHVKQDAQGNLILGGHDYKLDKNTFELKSLCIPFGVAVPSPEPTWELCTEKDGSEKSYLTTDVILWTGRFPELEDVKFSEEIFCNQSMEITPKDVQPYSEDNSYTEILSFTFDALCMLNKSDNKRLNIEPCFPNASIVKADFSLGDNNFREMFDEMKQELKSYFAANDKEDTYLEKSENKENVIISFSTLYREKYDILWNAISSLSCEVETEDGKKVETAYWLDDFDDEYIFFTENVWGEGGNRVSTHWKVEYAYDDTTKEVVIDGEAKRVSMVWLTDEEKALLESEAKKAKEDSETISAELNDYKETHSVANDEVEELRTYKADNEAKIKKAEADSILDEFAATIGNTEEFASIKENADKFSLDELKDKLFVVVGKFAVANIKAQEKAQNEKATFSKLPIDDSTANNKDSVAYGGIVEKYCRK